MKTIHVATAQPYDVMVGHGAVAGLAAAVAGAERVAVLYSPALAEYAASVVAGLDNVVHVVVPDGEAAKTPAVLASCWERLAEAGFTRSDAIVGVGGGATTDLAGLVAATWLRGVRYVSVPTTVLAMVDAAVGGKTGIDLPQGKNLVGAFWEPSAVFADLDALATLPTDELRSGLAEAVKHGFIADQRTLDIIAAGGTGLLDPANPALAEIIERSVAIKAGVVAADLRESTSQGKNVGREVLNYGHTLAHAIEKRENYQWRHGDAVAVGMMYAALVSRGLGLADDWLVEQHRSSLTSLGMPVTYASGAWPALRETMNLDKKTRGSQLRFVLLEGIGDPVVVNAPDERVLESAYAELTED